MRFSYFLMAFIVSWNLAAQDSGQKYLLVRADDMGSFHSANLACIKTAQEGIVRSIEVMVPCAWFPDAVDLLKKNPTINIGIHLVLTSEWESVKWRPVTHAPSIVDRDGYFFPFIWPNGSGPVDGFLRNAEWTISDIEKELRAQIELGIRHLPNVTHISAHMGFTSLDPSIEALFVQLASEYGLKTDASYPLLALNEPYGSELSSKKRVKGFILALKKMTPGVWVYVEHPGFDDVEMRGADPEMAYNRQSVTDLLTHRRVKRAIEKMGIKLIDYAALPQMAQ
jgi:chitin disaccharide deacetylase